jgi:23S rRNA G2069 N7-methylase RlmK/C1962 C5-methylase RlmI
MVLLLMRASMTLLLFVSLSSRTIHSFSSVCSSSLCLRGRSIRRCGAPPFLHQVTRSGSQEVATTTSNDEQQGTQQPQQQLLLASESPVIVLSRTRQSKSFRNGNQLVFSRAIERGTAPMSALVKVAVIDNADKDQQQQKQQQPQRDSTMPIGWGVFNPKSLYRIRILCHRYLQPTLFKEISAPGVTAEDALARILRHHFQVALQKRRALTLPNSDTTMYRLVNGEGDCLSGLQVDVINAQTIVVQSTAAWSETHKATILQALQQVMTQCDTIVWKVAEPRLKQDGYNETSLVIPEEDPTSVLALENGVTFQTFPGLKGQKTGVYCDQRENRRTLAQYCQDKTVLDLCCYHGGFSLTAVAKGGAMSAVGVDSSAAAIQVAQENARLNQCQDKTTFIQSDIADYMQQAAQRNLSFDVVVLDPPKLAPTESTLDKAARKYHGLNRDAIKLVNPLEGGLLMTCTCSAAMTQKEGGQFFLETVSGAALSAGRQVTLLSKAGAASCHTESPIAWPAGAYLTAALFYVHPL